MCPCIWWYTVTNMVTLKTVVLFLHDVHSIGNQFKLFYLYNYRVFYASTFSARDHFNNIHNLFYCSFLASQKYTMTSSNWCRWRASVYTFISIRHKEVPSRGKCLHNNTFTYNVKFWNAVIKRIMSDHMHVSQTI